MEASVASATGPMPKRAARCIAARAASAVSLSIMRCPYG